MERRALLKTGVGLGAWLTVERLGTAAASEAPGSLPRFFSGYLYGSGVSAWPLWMAWFGSRARGFCYVPGSIGTDSPVGYRIDGKVRGSHLSAQLYEAADRVLGTAVGQLGADLHNRGAGTFQIDAHGSGQFTVLPATADLHRMNRIVGSYSGVASDQNLSPVYDGNLRLHGNGKYEITRVRTPGSGSQPGVSLPSRLSGWFMISRDMDVWILPTPAPIDPNTPCASDPLACLPVYRCPLLGNATTVRVRHPLTGCVGSGYFHL